jgi:cation/acetate symporter
MTGTAAKTAQLLPPPVALLPVVHGLLRLFLVALTILENEGMPRQWIGHLYMFATIVLYAIIGVVSAHVERVRVLRGGAAGAGPVQRHGDGGRLDLGGQLHQPGRHAVPARLRRPRLRDGLDRRLLPGGAADRALPAQVRAVHDARFPGRALRRRRPAPRRATVRALAVGATIVVSFTYVVAQIYAVGLIASRFTGVDFSVGIFLGLASILVCSFLGGMRAITWTQVAQYIIILVAFLIPTDVAVDEIRRQSGAAGRLRLGAAQAGQARSPAGARPARAEVRARFQASADEYGARLAGLPHSWEAGQDRGPAPPRQGARPQRLAGRSAQRRARAARLSAHGRRSRARVAEQRAANLARAQPPEPHAEPFPGKTREESTSAATTSWRWCSA